MGDNAPPGAYRARRRGGVQQVDVRETSEDGDFKSLRICRQKHIQVKTERKLSSVKEDDIHLKKKPRISTARGNAKQEKLRIQLFDAVENGNQHDFLAMLSLLENIDTISEPEMCEPETGRNLFNLALDCKQRDIAKSLVSLKNDKLLRNTFLIPKSSRNALHQATQQSDIELVKDMMNTIPSKNDRINFIKEETLVEAEGQRPRTLTSYHLAAFNGCTELVEYFLDEGINIDILNTKKDTALLWAARWGHNSTVSCLLKRKARVDIENDKKSTALHWAVRYEKKETVRLLLEMGKANPNNRRLLGLVAPLVVAAAFGNKELVELLIRYKADVNIEIRGAETPLHHAAKEGHVEIVKFLIGNGADIKKKNEAGDTALILASRMGNADVVQELISCGADIYDKNHSEKDAWVYAMAQDDDDVLRVLTKHFIDLRENNENTAFKSPLFIAAALGCIDRIKMLLNMNVDPNEQDQDGNTMLHHAALHNESEVVKYFHDKVPINLQNNNKETALHIACRKGHYNTAIELMEKKAVSNKGNLRGENALHIAALSKAVTPDLAKAVVNHTIKSHDWESVNSIDKFGNNALHLAAKFASPEVLWEFRYVRFKDTDDDGNTPLHESVRYGKPQVLETILDIYENMQRDADINTRNNNSESVLHLAASNGFADSVSRLILYGADITCPDAQGNTVLHRLVQDMVENCEDKDKYMEVVKHVLDDSVRWWCSRQKLVYPSDDDALFQKYKRNALLYLLNDVQNKANHSVLAHAFNLGADTFINFIMTMPNIMMFRNHGKVYFDISHLTPRTNFYTRSLCGSQKVGHAVSNIDLLVTFSAKDRASNVLDIDPVRQVEHMYTTICAWAYAFFIGLHIIYMSLFSYFGITISAKFRDLPNLSSSDPILIATYIIVPIEPILFFMYIFSVLFTCIVRRKISSQSIMLLLGVFLLSFLTITWLILIGTRNTKHDYVLAICLCIGWLGSISFTRGFKGIHYFYRMLLNMIQRDILRFAIVFAFVLLAFGLGLHAIFQISNSVSETYDTPGDTLFLAFNMMIGMAELFDADFEAGMASVGRSQVFAKAFYLVYIILSTIILLNLLIAMMNDSYSEILKHQQVAWRVESVQIGLGVEHLFPWFPLVFSRVKVQRLSLEDVDEGLYRWYLVTTDDILRTYSKTTYLSDQTDQIKSVLENKLGELENRLALSEQITKETNKKFDVILSKLSSLEQK